MAACTAGCRRLVRHAPPWCNVMRTSSACLCAGLLGSNWLYLLDMAKKNVLQASATVIPAAATLYCMGIEARTGHVAGFDLSAFNKYRYSLTCAELIMSKAFAPRGLAIVL